MGILSNVLSPEKRDHPSNPSDWLLNIWNPGGRTATGIAIDEENALSSTAVFAAVKILSETIASLPLHLYKRLERGKKRAVDHHLYPILHFRPNPTMTSMAYREAMMGQLLLWGNSYSVIERVGTGEVNALYPLISSRVEVKWDRGNPFYFYTFSDGSEKIFPGREILHIAGFSRGGRSGYGLISQGREAIGLSLATEEYGARFFSNNAKPPVALEHPGHLGDKGLKNLRKALEAEHQGLSQSHKMMILEEGMKLHEYGVSPEDSQALETRKFQVTEIARLFNIPPHILKDLERATFSNIEHSSLEFVIYTLRPWLVKLEQNYSLQLLPELDHNEYFSEHLVDGLLRGNIESRYKAYATARLNGWMSANDIRELENMNPIEGGDIYLVPLNMQPINWLVGEKPKEEPKEEAPGSKELKNLEQRKARAGARNKIRAAYKRLFVEAATRVVNKETLAIQKAASKYLKRKSNDFEVWLKEFYEDLPDYIKKSFSPVLMTYAEAVQAEAAVEIGAGVGMTSELEKFVNSYLDGFSDRYIKSSFGQLQFLIQETDAEELKEVLETRIDEWAERNPGKIAADETVRSESAIARQVFLAGGIIDLVWQASGDSCPFCASLNGKRVGIDQPFLDSGDLKVEGEEKPMKIYGPKFHAPIHQGCVCSIVAG